jgi:peptidoglycan/LPS O-acetylase OafA/YrhL
MIFDLIRSAAALAVLVGHALVIFPMWQDPRQWLQQYGVIVFFLLSGFLISRTLNRRLEDRSSTFLDYAIDRWSRIYSAFLPAILLVAAIDYLTTSGPMGLMQETVDRYTAGLFLANLAMLQAPSVCPPFASAAPFWTVAIEFWIYIFVGLVAFSLRDGISLPKAIAIGFSGIIPVQSLSENHMVLVPWLLGAGIERVLVARCADKAMCRIALSMAGAGALFYLIRRTQFYLPVYSLSSYAGAAIVFASVVAFSERTKTRSVIGPAIAGWFASWSYSLYLLHHSILLLIAWGFGAYIGPYWGIAASIVTTISFASLTEKHHREIATYLKRRQRQIASMFQAGRT